MDAYYNNPPASAAVNSKDREKKLGDIWERFKGELPGVRSPYIDRRARKLTVHRQVGSQADHYRGHDGDVQRTGC